MLFSNFFKKPEYRKFNITPRYWDPAKDERIEREQRIKAELGIKSENGQYFSSIRGAFTNKIQHKHQSRSQIKRSSNLRVLIIFIVLSVLACGYLFGWETIVEKIQALLN